MSAAPSPSDVRLGARWAPAQAAKNHLLYAAIRVALACARPWSLRALRGFGRGVGLFAFRWLRRERANALRGLARAFPEASDLERVAIAKQAYAELGEHLGEAVHSLRAGASVEPLPFAPASLELLRDTLREGRGVLFASAHLGPWERVAASLVDAGLPFVTVAREAYDPRLTAIYDRVRSPRGVRAIYRGAAGAGARMLRALRRGEMLGMPMDLKTRAPSVPAPFLGEPAPTPVGPARLALRTGAAVVVGTAELGDDGRWQISATRIPTDALGPTDAERLTSLINDELSRRIRAAPRGWVWMHDRW